MAGNSWFRRHSQALAKAEQVPEGLWTKCPACSAILFMPELERNLRVCGKCGYHYRLGWKERLVITADEGSFEGLDSDLRSADPLDFPDYQQKLAKGRAAILAYLRRHHARRASATCKARDGVSLDCVARYTTAKGKRRSREFDVWTDMTGRITARPLG